MTSIKCPHCGLVQFASTEICKRCKKDISMAADLRSTPALTPENVSSSRFKSDNPLAAWLITLLLLPLNFIVSFVMSSKFANNPAEHFGGVIGGFVAWPLILMIIYALSASFRERYSVHAVINFGMGINIITGWWAR